MRFERVHEDIAAGRRWKALDRLQGMRASAPADQEVLELLGAVRADMGDLPAAGLAWFLTDGDDPRRDQAFAAMRERHGTETRHFVRHLKVRAPIERFPPGAQARLRDVQGELDAIGLRWDPAPRDAAAEPEDSSRLATVAVTTGCLALAAAAAVPWVRGVLAFLD